MATLWRVSRPNWNGTQLLYDRRVCACAHLEVKTMGKIDGQIFRVIDGATRFCCVRSLGVSKDAWHGFDGVTLACEPEPTEGICEPREAWP